jgi:hypothetical protein
MIPENLGLFVRIMIVLLCIPAILLLRMLFRSLFSQGNTKEQRSRSQLEANAVILAIEITGLSINHQAQVKLQMQVLPEKGRNFVAEIKEVFTVKELAALQAGHTMRVKYNPANTKEIALVKAA